MTKPRSTPFVISGTLFGVFVLASIQAAGGFLDTRAYAQSELRFVQPTLSSTAPDAPATSNVSNVTAPKPDAAPQVLSTPTVSSGPPRRLPTTAPNPLRFRTPETGKPSAAEPGRQDAEGLKIRDMLVETILPVTPVESAGASPAPVLPLLETHPLPSQGSALPTMPNLSPQTVDGADIAVHALPLHSPNGSAEATPMAPIKLPTPVLPGRDTASNASNGAETSDVAASVPGGEPSGEAEDPRIRDILRVAETMEREGRWSELLSYYESALKTHRDHPEILRKSRTARSHYDIICRYYDSSFSSLLLSARVEDNLVLFDEVVDKIQESHIDTPHWNDLFRFGLKDLEIALREPVFLQKHHLDAKVSQIPHFERELQAMIAPWEVGSREDLRNAVLHVAYLAQKTLGLNASAVLLEFICGVANSLDPHTAFLTKNQLNDTFSTINGDLVGLGVELKSDQHSLYIFRVISGGPAQGAGLRGGDRILSVDGKPTRGLDTNRAADMLLGEVDTPIRLMVQSPSSQPRLVEVRRRHIKVPSVEDVKMLNDHLGYLKLNCFQSTTTAEMREALWSLHSQGMRCLVVDLRHNPGGLLLVSIEVANLFLEKGVIVTTRVHPQDPGTPYMATAAGTWRTPLVVLIDEDSASASEVFAGAIRDHGRGVIVGRRSYGKGTVQLVHRLRGVGRNGDIAGLRLTVEKFYSPDGISCSSIGVDPDITVETRPAQWQTVARPVDGRIPSASTDSLAAQSPLVLAPSSAPNDPYILKAVETAREMLTTAQRPRIESQ